MVGWCDIYILCVVGCLVSSLVAAVGSNGLQRTCLLFLFVALDCWEMLTLDWHTFTERQLAAPLLPCAVRSMYELDQPTAAPSRPGMYVCSRWKVPLQGVRLPGTSCSTSAGRTAGSPSACFLPDVPHIPAQLTEVAPTSCVGGQHGQLALCGGSRGAQLPRLPATPALRSE